jgi:hypothetical protein
MKRHALYVLAAMFTLSLVASCVEDGYGLDNINQEGAFSHENGLYIPIGTFDTIHFYDVNISIPVEVTHIKTISGIFSETIYDYLVYTTNGREEALGSVALEGDFIAHIPNAAANGFSDFELSASVLKEDGEDTGIQIANSVYKASDPSSQVFNITIDKEDVLKLKEASTLQLIFRFEASGTSEDDYVLIENVKLKALGGISFNRD